MPTIKLSRPHSFTCPRSLTHEPGYIITFITVRKTAAPTEDRGERHSEQVHDVLPEVGLADRGPIGGVNSRVHEPRP